MARFDLTSVSGRLALADQIFAYSSGPHHRKHGPRGYENYESYRDWIRDDFSYRCVFSLFRETWPGCSLHVDHLISQKQRPDLICSYENLILLEGRANLAKGKKYLPDPGQIDLSQCLFVHTKGQRVGEIEALNPDGRRIVDTLRLNGKQAVGDRQKILGILRSVAVTDEKLFRTLVGYPSELPDLSSKNAPANTRPQGVKTSAYALRESGTLSPWV